MLCEVLLNEQGKIKNTNKDSNPLLSKSKFTTLKLAYTSIKKYDFVPVTVTVYLQLYTPSINVTLPRYEKQMLLFWQMRKKIM
jgi:hypothetical protein